MWRNSFTACTPPPARIADEQEEIEATLPLFRVAGSKADSAWLRLSPDSMLRDLPDDEYVRLRGALRAQGFPDLIDYGDTSLLLTNRREPITGAALGRKLGDVERVFRDLGLEVRDIQPAGRLAERYTLPWSASEIGSGKVTRKALSDLQGQPAVWKEFNTAARAKRLIASQAKKYFDAIGDVVRPDTRNLLTALSSENAQEVGPYRYLEYLLTSGKPLLPGIGVGAITLPGLLSEQE